MAQQFASMVEAEAYIRTKSVDDQEFRARLLSNPKATLAEEFELTIPDGFDVQVHEESASTSHFVIPPSAAIADEEMLSLAGGCSWCDMAND